MSSSVFVDTVHALAAAHHVDVDVTVEPGWGNGARTVVRPPHARQQSIVRVSTALTRQPAAVQAFMAAHEIAHITLWHRYRARAWPGALWALAVSTGQVAGLTHLLHQPTTDRPAWQTVLVLALGFLGPLVAGVGAQLLLAWRTRGCETAADAQARAWGYRLDDTIDGMAAALHAGETRLSTSRWYQPFRMHPMPTTRLRGAEERPDQNGGAP